MGKLKIKPLANRVIIEPTAAEEKTAGGIIIPDSAQEKPMQGMVVACGPGKSLESGQVMQMDVKAGQTIFFRKYAGTEVTIEGVEHCLGEF